MSDEHHHTVDKGPEPALADQLVALRGDQYSADELTSVIEIFGDAHYWDAIPDLKNLLIHEDFSVRYSTLEVLTLNFRLPELWDVARNFLAYDPNTNCRMLGASCLEVLKRDTADERTLAVLARVVLNEQEKSMVRKAAYIAMQGVIAYNYAVENTSLLSFNLAKDVDWELVHIYAQKSLD